MKLVIVEDEDLVAERILDLCKDVLGSRLTNAHRLTNLDDAESYLFNNVIDVLLLDLNLNGANGFDLLKLAVSGSFHTIIVTAYNDQAKKAFDYGVLDFVTKPVRIERLQQAFDRYFDTKKKSHYLTKYLAIRSPGRLKIIDVDDILYLKGAGIYVEIFRKNKTSEFHDKTMEKLESILPNNFIRIHKSYLVNLEEVKEVDISNYSKIRCLMKDGIILPVSRSRYRIIKKEFKEL